MTHPESLLPVPTNKRKRPLGGNDGDARKVAKCGGPEEPRAKQRLRIVTDISTLEAKSPGIDELLSSSNSDADSLFDEPSPRLPTPDIEDFRAILASKVVDEPPPAKCELPCIPARRAAPSIPGLYFDPTILLPDELGEELMWTCIRTFFQEGTANQVMLFERPPSEQTDPPSTGSPTGLPSFLTDLLSFLCDLLRPVVPPETHELLFSPSPASHDGPPRARQAIINLYWPGEGITPHVDLLDRYGDGIIAVSLGSGCAMQFAKVPSEPDSEHSTSDSVDQCSLYLPKGSILVMTEEARYRWTHGIDKGFDDLVEESPGCRRGELLERDVRLSITFRWLLPGADVVGSPPVQTDP